MTCSREDSAGGRGAVPHPVSPESASSRTARVTEDVVAMSAFQETTRPLTRDHVESDDNWPIEAHEKEASRSRSGRQDGLEAAHRPNQITTCASSLCTKYRRRSSRHAKTQNKVKCLAIDPIH